METKYSEKRGITTMAEYRPAGYSVFDASAVYAQYVTQYSISKGIITNAQFAGYVTADGKQYIAPVKA